jgi:superfamily I DNA/RNA helicase/RecB family exonuclease
LHVAVTGRLAGEQRPATTPYRLVRGAARAAPRPVLDDAQRAVVEHRGGPLLVLAGPGTGKTSTLVEAVAARIDSGADPEQVLVLTFSRKAAAELRTRITARLCAVPSPGGGRRTVREPVARTFHSYAFGVLRRQAVHRGERTPRLLTGAEQDVLVRELLAGDVEDGATYWPVDLRPALLTRGFAEELRDLLLRATERGIGPVELARYGRELRRPDWVAAARFFRQYLQVTALADHTAYDPAELIGAVLDAFASDPALLDRERGTRRHLFVDEYQDVDPAQEALLRTLAAGAEELVVVGDPDQSIYGFRGADPGCLRRFPEAFGHDRRPVPVVALGTSRRCGQTLLAASRRIAARLPVAPGLRGGAAGGAAGTAGGAAGTAGGAAGTAGGAAGTASDTAHTAGGAAGTAGGAAGTAGGVPSTAPDAAGGAAGGVAGTAGGGTQGGPPAYRVLRAAPRSNPGRLDVRLFRTPSEEAAYIAHRLRVAHLLDGVPWREMAVLVRSTGGRLPVLRRALSVAGVPVAATADELPLVDTAGAAPFLLLLRCALTPELLDENAAVELLSGPLGGADALDLRRLRQHLRVLELAAGGRRASGPLLVQALTGPVLLATVPAEVAAPAVAVAELLETARAAAADGTAEDVLWAVWTASGPAGSWPAASLRGGSVGAAADRDLDAMVALFDAAARFCDRLPGEGTLGFLDHLAGQQIPGDTLAAQAPPGDAVRVLTAHAAKGLQWQVVCVAGVQEGSWPDLRRRGTLLGEQALIDLAAGREPVPAGAAPVGPLLAEERRLFYVAVTRASRQLVVTATSDEQEQPSRFLDELDPRPDGPDGPAGVDDPRPISAVPRTLALPALVAELRQVACDQAQPALRQRAAAGELARLALAGVPGAHPDDWWGLPALSDPRPLREAGAPVTVSPSQVEKFATCPLRWLLESAGGTRGASAAQGLGNLVHELAALAADPDFATADALLPRLEDALARMDLGGPWTTRRERERARSMLAKFLTWLDAGGRRELVGVELPFSVGVDGATLTGRVDRLERDADGRLVVIDLKTGRTQARGDDVARHPQLGAYQVAAQAGGFGEPAEPGGAALVQLGSSAAKAKQQDQPPLGAAEDPDWARRMVVAAAEGMAGATFAARENGACRMCPVRTSCPAHDEGRQVL